MGKTLQLLSVCPQKSVKEGLLLKQTSSFQRWKRRYFKLRGRTLYYAQDSKARLSPLWGGGRAQTRLQGSLARETVCGEGLLLARVTGEMQVKFSLLGDAAGPVFFHFFLMAPLA